MNHASNKFVLYIFYIILILSGCVHYNIDKESEYYLRKSSELIKNKRFVESLRFLTKAERVKKYRAISCYESAQIFELLNQFVAAEELYKKADFYSKKIEKSFRKDHILKNTQERIKRCINAHFCSIEKEPTLIKLNTVATFVYLFISGKDYSKYKYIESNTYNDKFSKTKNTYISGVVTIKDKRGSYFQFVSADKCPTRKYKNLDIFWININDIVSITILDKDNIYNFANKLTTQKLIEKYEKFLNLHSKEKYKNIISKRIEDLVFDLVVEKKSITSYKNFISKYPNNRHISKAKNNLENLEFQFARRSNSIDDCNRFLSNFPNSKYAAILKIEMENLLFSQANNKESTNLLKKYLSKYPNGIYSRKAQEQIEFLIIKSAKKADSLDLYKEYLNNYPKGAYKDVALKRIKILEEKADFEKSLAENTIKAYINYLTKYPKGNYIIDAQWNIINLKNKIDLFKTFITEFPNSKYSSIATEKILEYQFEKCKSIKCYEKFVEKYAQTEYCKIAYKKILSLTKKNIRSYNNYLKKYPKSNLRKDVIAALYRMYQKKNTIIGYEEFLRKYPYSEQFQFAKESIIYLKLNQKNINEIYLQAGKHERSNDIMSATKLYKYIIDKYPSNDLAIKSNDRLLAIKNDRDKQKEKTVNRKLKSIDSRNNPCKHVYVGKSYECYCVNFIVRMCDTCTVLGFSEQSGRASILIKSGDGYTRSKEISCNKVPK